MKIQEMIPKSPFFLFCLLTLGCVTQKEEAPPASKLRQRSVVVQNDLAPGTPRAPLPAPVPIAPAPAKKPKRAPRTATPVAVTFPPVQAITLLRGKVLSANVDLHFAVVDFTISHFPSIGQKLGIFRNNLKIGEIRMGGPFQNGNGVGDIIDGEAQVGDEVRGLDQ